MNEWYMLVFSADDISAAKHLELERHFKNFFLAAVQCPAPAMSKVEFIAGPQDSEPSLRQRSGA
jgi:hypothetical protein